MGAQNRAAVKTLVMGGLGVLMYKNYERKSTPRPTIYKDELGNPILFHDKAEFEVKKPGAVLIDEIKSIYSPSILHLAYAVTGLFALRSYKVINSLMKARYADPVYQILRPDVLKNKIHAWKVLGLGFSLIPCLVIAGLYYMRDRTHRILKHSSSLIEPQVDHIRQRLSYSSIGPGGLSASVSGKELNQFIRRLRNDQSVRGAFR